MTILAITVSVLFATTLILTGGNILLTFGLVAVAAAVVVTLYRVDWGLYILAAAVLFFDQFPVPEFEPFTYLVAYFENLKVFYLPNVEAAVVSPFEIHLLFLVGVWATVTILRRDRILQPPPVWPVALAFFAWVIFSMLWGLKSGGDLLPALWEVRALCYFGILYFLVPQIITEKKQITILMWICIAAISFKAFQGIERFVRLDFSFQGIPALTSHEDAAFFVTLVSLFFGLVLFGGNTVQKRTLYCMLIPLLVGYVVAQRRAAFGATVVALVAIFALVNWRERLKFLRLVAPVVILLGSYLYMYWESDSPIASPAQLIRASFSNERDDAGEKYYSNLYRVHERYNLAVTVQRAPVNGIGFGKTYDTPIKLARIPFPLWEYIPHNEILWLLVKTGAIGFLAFLVFLETFVYKASATLFRLRDPYLKAVCIVVIVAVLSQVFISYFDLQLTFHRNMAYLGILMGLLPTIEVEGGTSGADSA